jgi:hypothetical protein
LDVLLLDCDALGVDGTQIRVVEQADEESLGSFLQGCDCLALPSVGAVHGGDVLTNLSDLDTRVSFRAHGRSSAERLTNRWKGAFIRRSSVDFWYRRISLSARVPGL